MKQLLSILTLFAVPLTSGAVNAGEEEDREAIRALFHQEGFVARKGMQCPALLHEKGRLEVES